MKSLTQMLPSLSGMTLKYIHRLTSGPHNYPKKRKTLAEKSCVVDLAAMALSDLEDLDSDEEQ